MEPTVVDIIFYNEISTVLMLTRIKGFKRAYPKVEPWLMAMGEIEELSNQEEKLVDIIEKYQLE